MGSSNDLRCFMNIDGQTKHNCPTTSRLTGLKAIFLCGDNYYCQLEESETSESDHHRIVK
jgi:hypothetical protein